MRLNINLASLKYEDVRRFYVRWGATLAALAVLAVTLAALSYIKYFHAKTAFQQTRILQQNIDALTKQRDQLVSREIAPENKDVTQEKKYWNIQISKRAFSWTQLLNDMQKIMPSRAFLQSVHPELTDDNRLKLVLVIDGEKLDDARELQKRMENSVRFSEPRIDSEKVKQGSKPGLPPTFEFDIGTFYNPAGPSISLPSTHTESGRASQRRVHHATEGT
jgi:type IV pilus assembly protein PilN